METFFWTVIGFISGAVPYSVITGYLASRVDIRQYGDSNPGSTNVLRALGWRWALPAFLLDYLKGAVPVSLAYFQWQITGWEIVPIALAPILGHAFSPFLRGRGGKAVAVSFGVWTGLTIGAGPSTLGLLLGLMFAVIKNSAWAMMLAFLFFGGFIIPYYASAQPEFTAVWLGNLIVFALKHGRDLKTPPQMRLAFKHRNNQP